MKKSRFNRDEKRKIINYIQEILNIKIISPRKHSSKECDEDIKKIFQECYMNTPNTYVKEKYTKEKHIKEGDLRVKELEKLLISKNIDNDLLTKEVLKLSKENRELKKKLRSRKIFWIF